jgi:hypothetical protein
VASSEPALGAQRPAVLAILYPALLVVGGVALLLGSLLVWVDRTILDSDEFASSATGALDEPRVQQRVADVIAQRLVESGAFSEGISTRLPQEVQFATPLIEEQLQSLLARVGVRVLAADATASIIETIVERLHARLLAILEDDESLLHAEGDTLVIDVGTVLRQVVDRLGVAMPQRLEDPSAGELVLVEDTTVLQQTSTLVRNRGVLQFGLLGLAAVAFTGAVFAAPERSRGLSRVAMVLILTGVVTLAAIFIGNQALRAAAEERLLLRELVRSFESNLRLQALLLVVLGGAILAATDPRMRGHLENANESIRTAISRIGTGPAVLMAAGAIVLLLLAL